MFSKLFDLPIKFTTEKIVSSANVSFLTVKNLLTILSFLKWLK